MTIGFDFTGGNMPPGATLARGSSGARTNSSGLIVWEANDTARFDYDPISHLALGILIEPPATNLMLQSQAFESASWTKNEAAVTANAAVAPDNSGSGDFIVPSTATGNHYVKQSPTLVAQSYTRTLFFKKGAYTKALLIAQAAGGFPYAVFDLDAQSATIFGAQISAASIAAQGNGWFRCTITYAAPTGTNVTYTSFSNTTNYSFTGDGSSGGYVWQDQLEAGSASTSPIATTSTPATRAADILTLNWGLLGVGDGTITVRYTFDDNSTQDVATTISGGTSVVPTNLNRPRIKSAVGLGVTVPDTLNNPAIFPILPGQSFPVTKTPVWSTRIATANSGRERRRKQWSYPKWRFKISHDVLRDAASFGELQRLWAFFNAKAGQYAEFSYFDAADSNAADQPFGTGDGVTTTFQLSRTIGAGAMAFTEPVRSVAGLPTIKIDGSAISAFALGANGLVTFSSAPAAGSALTWSGQFMFLVRFEQDELEAEQMMQSLWSQGGLTLVTVRT